MSGKGDKRRPCEVPREVFDANWEAIFNAKPNENSMLGIKTPQEEKIYEKGVDKLL